MLLAKKTTRCYQEIRDLEDYVFGVETGLDTNARKNRSGEITESLVKRLFTNAGIDFRQQVSSNEFPAVAAALGADQKIFDFVITTDTKTYLIEVNFYSGGGSKLNEVARSYTDIAPKINGIKGFEFVWITDGIGWNSARNKLQCLNLKKVDTFGNNTKSKNETKDTDTTSVQ